MFLKVPSSSAGEMLKRLWPALTSSVVVLGVSLPTHIWFSQRLLRNGLSTRGEPSFIALCTFREYFPEPRWAQARCRGSKGGN